MLDATPAHEAIAEELQAKIKTLHGSIWERRADWPQVLTWLQQFKENSDPLVDEQLQALRLLSNFMYFGVNEIRALLRSLYRDTFRPQVAKEIRENLGTPANHYEIKSRVDDAIRLTRFVSLGNPSESSAFLLYYFRQENALPKDLFIHASDIFDLSQVGSAGTIGLKDPAVLRYVFIDDLCGSGVQCEEYAKSVVTPLKHINCKVRAYYYPLFGLADGIDHLTREAKFDVVYPVVELDSSFRAFAAESRIFAGPDLSTLRAPTEVTCRQYGDQLWPEHPLGYEDSQLYIGFAHNTPDNSLPIFWSDHTAPISWRPIFKRYPRCPGDGWL